MRLCWMEVVPVWVAVDCLLCGFISVHDFLVLSNPALPCSGPAQAEQENWQIYEFLICNVSLHTCLLQGEMTHRSALPCACSYVAKKNVLNRKRSGIEKKRKRKEDAWVTHWFWILNQSHMICFFYWCRQTNLLLVSEQWIRCSRAVLCNLAWQPWWQWQRLVLLACSPGVSLTALVFSSHIAICTIGLCFSLVVSSPRSWLCCMPCG